jgi:hypothetical protein
MYAEKKRLFGGVRVALCATLLLTALVRGQNLLAELDLENDGSVTQSEVSAICDRISKVISKDSTYMQFERAQLPELLKQLYIEESATACSDPQCLTVIGSLIGANFVVGGSIRKNGKETVIELNLVDVANKKAVNTAGLQTKAQMNVLIESEIPALVKDLLAAEKNNSQKAASNGKKTFFANPLVYIKTGLVSAIAGGAYYYLFCIKSNSTDKNNDIPLDDAPVRRRNN